MPAHNVKCLYCNEIFDANSEENVKIERRYAHKKCYDENYNPDDAFIPKIYEYLNELNIKYNFVTIDRQRKKFISNGLTNEGIYYSLLYWFGIKNGSIERADGRIGIVPYIYDEAQIYYNEIKVAKNKIKANLETNMKIVNINYDLITQKGKKEKIDLNSLFN